jgi:hypothetical protein
VAAAEARPPQNAGPLTPVLAAMLRPDPDRRLTAAESGVALHGVADGNPLAAGVWDRTAGETRALTAPADPAATAEWAGPAATATAQWSPPAANPARGNRAPATERIPPRRGGGGTLLASPPPERRPTQPAGQRPNQRQKTLLGVGAVVLVAAIAIVLALLLPTGSNHKSNTAKNSPHATGGPHKSAAPAALSAAVLTRAVSDYYGLLPAEPAEAWTHLAPVLHAGGVGPYRAHWATVQSLSLVSPPQVVDTNTVSVNIQLTQVDGTTVHETHHLGLIRDQARILIKTDKMIGHTTTAAPPSSRTTGKTSKQSKKAQHGNGNDQGNGHGAKGHPKKAHGNNG